MGNFARTRMKYGYFPNSKRLNLKKEHQTPNCKRNPCIFFFIFVKAMRTNPYKVIHTNHCMDNGLISEMSTKKWCEAPKKMFAFTGGNRVFLKVASNSQTNP